MEEVRKIFQDLQTIQIKSEQKMQSDFEFARPIKKYLPAKKYMFNPLPHNNILNWSKLKLSCRQHFKMHLKWKISIV